MSPLCTTCDYYKKYSDLGVTFHHCKNEQVINHQFPVTPVTGEQEQERGFADKERSAHSRGPCGSQGKLWKEKVRRGWFG
jgi:hypothetical protein